MRIPQCTAVAMFCLMLLAGSTKTANADVLYKDFNAASTYTGGYFVNDVQTLWAPFTATQSGTATSISLEMYYEALGAQPVTVYLELGNPSAPSGDIIETYTEVGSITSAIATAPSPVQFVCSGTCPTLSLGTTYWVEAVAGGTEPVNWDAISNTSSLLAYTNFNVSGLTTVDANTVAFEVDGPNAITPEPSGILLFGSGLAAMASIVRRHHRQ